MLSVNVKNTVKKGEVIYRKGENAEQVAVILSGKVQMKNEWFKLSRGQWSFIGLNDIESEVYNATYTALEDSVVYAISTTGAEPIHQISSKSADFRAIMISSQLKLAAFLGRLRSNLQERTAKLYQSANLSYSNYKEICASNGLQIFAIQELEELQPFLLSHDIDDDKVRMYEECAKIPLAAQKMYYSYSEDLACLVTMEAMHMVKACKEDCEAMAEYMKETLMHLGLRPSHNLFEYCCVQAQELRKSQDVPKEMKNLLDDLVEEVSSDYSDLRAQCQELEEVDFASMRERANTLTSKQLTETEKKNLEEREASIKRDVLSLKDSMNQIAVYGNLSEDKAKTLKDNVDTLVNAPDRLSVEDDVKKAKKAITPIVFELYLACYNAYRKGIGIAPKSVELFLNFGMLDERLLDESQLEFLCGIQVDENEGPCNVFTMTQWLDEIAAGRREPSKSEFDEDYIENLRTLKKQGDITETQQKELLNDMDKRVEYEVMNMQMSNTKVVFGQPSAYMPILFKEAMFGNLDKILVTKQKINEAVQRILKIDYSVFYREVIYSNNDLKIVNETIMKEIFPDVILFPLYGTNASMWQEVGGKNKATPGRFCFPIMTNSNIEDLMVKMFGRFRWELCRCIQGMSWNDVKVKSLTSEYMDYIQFYRKNRELSEEAKEKVKLQIQKARNNSREMFLIDYEFWVKSECNGSVKMNKVAREIVATYCPFEKELRTKLGAQRQYEIAMARREREATKKKQEFDLKIKSLQKITEDIPKEMQDTYNFYADM